MVPDPCYVQHKGTTLVKNAYPVMSFASVLDDGMDLTFVDGCSGWILFNDLYYNRVKGAGLENTW